MQLKYLFFTVLICAYSNYCFSQHTFTVNNSSKVYTAKIKVEKCAEEHCGGKGSVKLYAKNSGKLLQELKSPDLTFYLDKDKKPSAIMELYDEESPLVFGDFNFDGTEDIAVRNGSNSGYGGASYDVYVFNSTKKKFVSSKELTTLASTNLGMFEVDKKRKVLKTSTKSGCCWHRFKEYKVVPAKGLVTVFEKTEDAAKGDDYVYVTEKKLTNGKWASTSKKHKIKDYYKE